MITTLKDTAVVIEKGNDYQEWASYAASCSKANIYHLPEWSIILQESFGYIPYHLLAKDTNGKVQGILPLFLVKSLISGNRLVSLPFSYNCGPIADSDNILYSLLEESKRLTDSLKCRYLEIKVMKDGEDLSSNSFWKQNKFEVVDQFSTFVLDLSQPDTVWKKLDPRVRQHIRRAKRDDVKITKGNSIKAIRTFYKLNLRTKKRIGVPGHPESLFINMFEKLSDKCILYLAELQGEIIAGIIIQKFNNIVLYGYGASNDKYRMHQPNSLLLWTAIEEACQDGYRYFDFGRTSPIEQSVTLFKKHWGTEEKNLAYYYYPCIPNSMALNQNGITFKIANSLWKKLPLPLARICSNKIFAHLG